MLIHTIKELKAYLADKRNNNKTIGLVPTMGFLHDGHLSLIKKAKVENDVVVVSDFVNPTQFAPNEDFESYPRNIDNDTKMAVAAGADVVFYPTVEEMYPSGSTTFVEVTGNITQVLCGASRPSHFRGVTTVVNMLFNIVQPHRAYFGQKDAQQAAILIKMVKELHISVELITCPIVREKDGLAMSSRNTYLTKDERQQAPILRKALLNAKTAFENGNTDAGELVHIVSQKIGEVPLAKIDYVKIYEYPTLEKIVTIHKPAIVAVAVYFGKTRLIDNILLKKK